MSLLISQQKVNIILKQNNIFCTVVSGLKGLIQGIKWNDFLSFLFTDWFSFLFVDQHH